MVDIFSAIDLKPDDSKRILDHLQRIKDAQAGNGDLSSAISAAMEEFNKFFLNYHEKYFSANKFLRNDTPSSAKYNENMLTLANDIDNLYSSLSTTAKASISAYNFSSISSNEIKKSAEIAASKVLDLNILSDFIKGTTIVGGDDFIDNSKIDSAAAVETQKAYIIQGASSVGLKPIDTKISSGPNTKIAISPLMPSNDGAVNISPTPDNLNRFYEGKFYARIGEQRPEGGFLHISYIADPSDLEGLDELTEPLDGKLAFYAVELSSELELSKNRKKMLDNNPDTFWEAEWVVRTEPLADPIDAEEGVLEVDIAALEQIAKQFDALGQDLMFHIDYDFGEETPVNLVTIDPVLFGTQAFTEIDDVATVNSDGVYETVDGFEEQQFDKILTPEANKAISDDLVKKTLAPSQYAYGGLGVFQFPMRFTTKLRVTFLMRDPVPDIYERQYVLTETTIIDTTTKTTTKKGLGAIL